MNRGFTENRTEALTRTGERVCDIKGIDGIRRQEITFLRIGYARTL